MRFKRKLAFSVHMKVASLYLPEWLTFLYVHAISPQIPIFNFILLRHIRSEARAHFLPESPASFVGDSICFFSSIYFKHTQKNVSDSHAACSCECWGGAWFPVWMQNAECKDRSRARLWEWRVTPISSSQSTNWPQSKCSAESDMDAWGSSCSLNPYMYELQPDQQRQTNSLIANSDCYSKIKYTRQSETRRDICAGSRNVSCENVCFVSWSLNEDREVLGRQNKFCFCIEGQT